MPPTSYRAEYCMQMGKNAGYEQMIEAATRHPEDAGEAHMLALKAAEAATRLTGPKAKPDASQTQVFMQKIGTVAMKAGVHRREFQQDVAVSGITGFATSFIPIPVIGSLISLATDKIKDKLQMKAAMQAVGAGGDRPLSQAELSAGMGKSITAAEHILRKEMLDNVLTRYEFLQKSLQNLGVWVNEKPSDNCRIAYNAMRSAIYIQKEFNALLADLDWLLAFLQAMDEELKQVADVWPKIMTRAWAEIAVLAASGRRSKKCADCGKHPKDKCMRSFYRPPLPG